MPKRLTKFRSPDRRFAHLAILAVAWVAHSASAAEEAAGGIADYFDGLRSRGLFTVAENYAIDRLAAGNLAEPARVKYATELAWTYASHADQTAPGNAEELWNSAFEVLEKEGSRPQQESTRLVFLTQKGLVDALKSESLAWNWHAEAMDAQLLSRCVAACEKSLEGLRLAEAELTPVAKPANRQDVGDAAARGLLYSVWLNQAKLLLLLAELKSQETALKVELSRDAHKILQKLTSAGVADGLQREARLMAIGGFRLRTDFESADRYLSAIEKGPPEGLTAGYTAERMRLALAQNQPAEAVSYLLAARKRLAVVTGEINFLAIQALDQARNIADQKGEKALAKDLSDEMDKSLARIDLMQGGIWAWRCRRWIERTNRVVKIGAELDQSIRKAESTFAQGDKLAAAVAYQQAIDVAEKEGQAAQIYELAYRRGSILAELFRFEEASASFQLAAGKTTDRDLAATSDLMSAWAMGRSFDRKPTTTGQENYRQALRQHLVKYPNLSTTSEAIYLLARLDETQSKPDEAMDNYRKIPADHRLYGESLLGRTRCHLSLVQSANKEGRDKLGQLIDRARKDLTEELRRGMSAESPSALTCEAALTFARILMFGGANVQTEHEQYVTALQEQFAKHNDGKEPEWAQLRERMAPMSFVAAVINGREQQATASLEQLAKGPVRDSLLAIQQLAEASNHTDEATAVRISEWRLRLLKVIENRRTLLGAAEKMQLDIARIGILLETGQPTDGVKAAREAIARNRFSNEQFFGIAAQLEASKHAVAKEAVRDLYRLHEKKVAAGSDEWVQARAGQIRMMAATGDQAGALKLLDVTRLLYPKLVDHPQLRHLAQTIK